MTVGWVVTCNEQEIWAPSLRVGRLFLDEVQSLERLFAQSSGIESPLADMMEVDAAALEAFVETLLRELERTNNGAWFALMEGCLEVMIALNARITGRWPNVSDRLKPLVARAQTVMLPIAD